MGVAGRRPGRYRLLRPETKDLETEEARRLSTIHAEIDHCRICEGLCGAGYKKPIGLLRGGPSKIVVIGQGPGRTEVEVGRAFSGQSGRRLDSWLVSSGADPAAPRSKVYTTSVIKCVCPSPAHFEMMKNNCAHFLDAQMAVLRPAVVITLGEKAFAMMNLDGISYGDAVCQLLPTEEWLLITRFGFHFKILPWPHPSGLNRWHNSPVNRARLESSFGDLRPYLGEP